MRINALISVTTVLAAPLLASAAETYDPARDKSFDLPEFTLEADAGGPTNEFTFTYTAQGDEVGFSFAGDYTEVPASASWASDTKLEILINQVLIYEVGGFSNVINDWDFQGSQSTFNDFYAHGVGGEAWDGDGNPDWGIKGLFDFGDVVTFRWTNDWASNLSSDLTWSNAILTIHKIPAPATLALIGVAGLLGARRRRS